MSLQRILVVDDYPDALEIWTVYLRSLGLDVYTAADGIAAVEVARAQVPDVIVLDLDLPGITGFEAARRIRDGEETANIPLIAATSFSHGARLSEARDAGFDTIMIKPFEPAALMAEIARLAGQRPRQFAALQTPVKRLNQNR